MLKRRGRRYRAIRTGLLVLLMSPVWWFAANRATAAQPPSDATITYWAQNALREDPRVPSEELSVVTANGIVTLSGTVNNLAGRKYADLEVEKINGVRGVIDNIKVNAPFEYDLDIAQNILHRILNSSAIKSRGIQVDVDTGNVTLSGTVSSWDEAKQAELLASETEGVRSVTDNLVMQYPKKRSDQEIDDDVADALSRDIYLTGYPIKSSVQDGTVTLTGDVGSAYAKQRAAADARWIWSVKAVKNDLDVVWWDDAGARTHLPVPSDEQLVRNVHDELDQDLRLELANVTVSARLGNVTLRGSVPTFYQKRLAGQDAHDVVGTAWVTNLLSVTEENRSDKAILTDIRFDIDTDFALDLDMIHASVRNGVVTLSGNVNDMWEKSHAYDLVSRIRGVREVVNNVQVNYSALYTDASIRDRIVERFHANADTRWVADDIKVAVNNGKVTLSGTVDFWSEYDSAQEVAYETDGVWAVDNKLDVRNYNYDWADFSNPWPNNYAYGTYYPPYLYFIWWS